MFQVLLLIVLRQIYLAADGRLPEVGAVRHALAALLRHPAGYQLQSVQAVRHTVSLYHPLAPVLQAVQHIEGDGTLRRLHVPGGGKGVYVLLVEAQRGNQAEVIDPMPVQVIRDRSHHSLLRHFQACEKAHPQRDNGKNSQKAPEA